MENGVRSVCFRGDFAIKHTSRIPTLKLVWKCVTGWSILSICNTFSCWLILLSFLYFELAPVCCTNPDNVHYFGTIFPNLEFVFASICTARLVPIQSDQYRSCSTVKWRSGCGGGCHSRWAATKNRAVALSSRNNMISIHQRSARTNEGKQRSFKFTVSWMVSPCSASCSWRPLHWRIGHSLLTSRQFHILVAWLLPRRIRPQRTRLSQCARSLPEHVASNARE